ncbi:MAG: PilW family protein [Chitinivibrionales bacterium]|nr:PilW family protein [Chitinivibrionales bacterium]
MKSIIKKNQSNGYSLLELILYMMGLSLIVWTVFSYIGSMSKGFSKEVRTTRMQDDGRNVIMLMAREIINTGYKFVMVSINGTADLQQIPMVTVGENGEEEPADKVASFNIVPALIDDRGDELEIYKASVDLNGQNPITERIRYILEEDRLIRVHHEHNGISWTNESRIELARNIDALQFQFSTDRISWINDPRGVKAQIRAIKIIVLVRTKGTSTEGTVPSNFAVGDISVTYPSDGFLRRLYEEIVEVENNGRI